jgi:uncharacterized protein (TIGR02284 family)
MATRVGKQDDLVAALCSAIELDFDAIEAYEAAIERLDHAVDKARFREFLEDHRRHVLDLTQIVRELGGTAPTKADVKAILTKGKVVIMGLVGTRGVLEAMKANEDDTNLAYERLCQRGDTPERVRVVLQRNLADERRHRAYIEQRLGRVSERISRPSAPSVP